MALRKTRITEDIAETVEEVQDLSRKKISFGAMWKVVTAVFMIALAWGGQLWVVNGLRVEVAAQKTMNEEQKKELSGLQRDVFRMQRTQCAALTELSKYTQVSYYIVPEDTDLYGVAEKLKISVPVLERYNVLPDQSFIKKGTIIKYPKISGAEGTTMPEMSPPASNTH
jgi:hypothetical protein